MVSRIVQIVGLLGLLCNPCSGGDIDRGRDLFVRNWISASSENKSPSDVLGDGLGPQFNARSCVSCHHQGGVGGGGGFAQNIHMLTVAAVDADPRAPAEPFDLEHFRANAPHPSLRSRVSTIVHRFSTNPRYAIFRRNLLYQRTPQLIGRLSEPTPPDGTQADNEDAHTRTVAIIHSQRNTPALFGAGLIDSIPKKTIESLAQQQHERFPEVEGRIAEAGGKFGWRGQHHRLARFVTAACASELGLQNIGFSQPRDPLATQADIESDDIVSFNEVHDISLRELDALTAFISNLPPPRRMIPPPGPTHGTWRLGRRVFDEVRCGACHVSQVGYVRGIYSDLLLHDMGPDLSDAAHPARVESADDDLMPRHICLLRRSRSGEGYFGGQQVAGLSLSSIRPDKESTQLWRTPPLWGVRDTAPYLHDGRAATIEDAILWHGGEGETSRRLFERLDEESRQALVFYVRSLGAP